MAKPQDRLFNRRCSNMLPADADLNEDVVRRLVSADPLAHPSENVFIGIKGVAIRAKKSPCVNVMHLPSAVIHKDSLEYNEESVDWAQDVTDEESETSSTNSSRPSNHCNQFIAMARDTRPRKIIMEVHEVQTEEPKMRTLNEQISKSIIYDDYERDYRATLIATGKLRVQKEEEEEQSKEINWGTVAVKARMLERVVSHSVFKDTAMKFRYHEDTTEGGPKEGNLLPLWRLILNGVDEMPLTDLHWIREEPNLLAATYGSYDFLLRDKKGVLAIWSLNNALYPEYMYATPTPAQCVAVHPQLAWLAAVGLHDGNVVVYDILSRSQEPELRSARNTKHDSAVQAIRWKDDDNKEELTFYTIACDGNVKSWLMMKTRLESTVIFSIPMNRKCVTDEGVLLDVKGSGFRLEFSPSDQEKYLIGTRRGQIYECNVSIGGESLCQYNGHDTICLSVQYNTFYPKIFLSCSADWRVFIWEDGLSKPLLEFNLERQVTDAKWAPYSSTVFAASTIEGTIHMFDLQEDRFKAVLSYKAIDYQPTRIAFNAIQPYLIVMGDTKGQIRTFKISKHLRMPAKASKKEALGPFQLEVNKLLKVLAFMKPKVLEYPADESCFL